MGTPTTTQTVRTAGSIFTLIGALIALTGSQMKLEAQLLSQQDVLLAAAPQTSSSSAVLAFGMLMMLIGFGLHAWYVVNKDEGKPVPVHPAAKKLPRNSRRQADVIWVERTIRF